MNLDPSAALILAVCFAGIWIGVCWGDAGDHTPNWRRWAHIQWLGGLFILLSSPSLPFAALFLSVALSYWRRHIEVKSDFFYGTFIKFFFFAAIYAIAFEKVEGWMMPFFLLFLVLATFSVFFWICLVLWKGEEYQFQIFGRTFLSYEEVGPGAQYGLRPHGRMMNPSHTGALGALCVFAGFGLAAMWHPAFLIASLMGFWIVYRTKTTGAVIGLGLGFLGWVWALPEWRMHLLHLGAFLAIIGAFYKLDHPSARKNLFSWRLHIWKDSIKICLGRPWMDLHAVYVWLWGLGPSGWFHSTKEHLTRYGGTYWVSPHNEFIHILCDYGILGLAALGWFIWWIMAPSISLGGSEAGAFLGVMGCMLGVAFYSFPWRGTSLTQSQTNVFQKQEVIDENNQVREVLTPTFKHMSNGTPSLTWIAFFLALIGPHLG